MATDRIVEIRPKDILVTSRIPAKVTDDDKPVDFYGIVRRLARKPPGQAHNYNNTETVAQMDLGNVGSVRAGIAAVFPRSGQTYQLFPAESLSGGVLTIPSETVWKMSIEHRTEEIGIIKRRVVTLAEVPLELRNAIRQNLG